ncbi:MAG: type II secretion system protein [Pseudomonadota bacterium]
MKRQGGFTLIELVVVIVILGILAVTAAPRFLNLQGDAREASLNGLRGAMQGAVGIVYGRSAIEGEERLPSATTDDNITTAFGYPTANATGIEAAVDGLTGNDWASITVPNTPASSAVYSFSGTTVGATWDATASSETGCFVVYTEAASAGNSPTITTAADQC